MTRFAILISGRGSNMAAILDFWRSAPSDYPTEESTPVLVLSNRPDAPGLDVARQGGVATEVLDHKAFGSRAEFDAALLRVLEAYQVDAIVLAGFMRILSDTLVERYPEKIVNIHPSLLPAFIGLDAPGQAIAAGVKISGCTVHFVEAALDSGPVIAQRALEVSDTDTPEGLQARIQALEHKLYPKIIAKVFAGHYTRKGRLIALEGGRP